MRRLTVALAMAVVALVVASGLAWASFTAHRTTPQQFTAVDSFDPPVSGELVGGSRSNDAGASTSQIQMGLQLRNTGGGAIDLTEVTVRYWFSSNGGKSLNAACYYASFGCQEISLSITRLSGAHDGADNYLQVGFGAGSISPDASVDLEQLAVLDQGGNVFDQRDDWSFLDQGSFGDNDRVTVYLRGELVWGSEPGDLPDVESVEVQYANGDQDPRDAAIKPFLAVVNSGTVDVPLQDLTLRYWFTRETSSEDLLGFCDYAVIGCSGLTTRFVAIGSRPGADTYLEVGFTGGQLETGSSTGSMQLRAHRADWGLFDETDDYSRDTNNTFAQTVTVTAYLRGQLVWGTEP